jgi:MFS family permease
MSGVGFYAFGVFFKPVQEEFNWARGVTSVAFLMFYLVQAISSPFIGGLTDRFGPKKMLTLGGLALGAGLALLSLTASLPHFYVAYGIVGLGCSATGMVPVSFVISNWFPRRRGIALGIVSSGMGMGGLVLPMVIGIYLIPNFGWRTAYQTLALLTVLIIISIAQIVMKTSPVESRQISDNVEHSHKTDETSSQPSEGWKLNAALKTSTFWLMVGSYVVFQMAHVGTLQHLINHLTDIGFPVAMATATLSVVSLVSAGGKFFFGYITDRLAAKYCATISFILGFVATTLLMIVAPTSPILLIGLYIFTMGLAIGGWAPITSMLVSTNFGMKHYGAIFGVFSLFFYITTGISPTFFGYVYDVTGQYYLAYISALVFYSVATLFILAMRRSKQPS